MSKLTIKSHLTCALIVTAYEIRIADILKYEKAYV